jgi:hypothetical protein
MNKQVWMAAVAAGALTLIACGGEDSAPPPVSSVPSPTPTPSPSGPYTGQLYLGSMRFTTQPDAFVGELPFLTTAATSHAVLDVNSDGFLDIVFAFWSGLGPDEWGQNVGDRVTPNKLAIFINQGGRQFVDQTDTYLTGGADLGGATRKVEKVDLNRDGKLDLVFAVNREDGRSGDPVAFSSAQSAALISRGNGYQIFKFGDPDWNHNVVVGELLGKAFVATSGFVGAESSYYGFTFENDGFSRRFQFPFQVSPNTARFISDGTSGETNILIQTQSFPNLLGVEAWKLSAGIWSKVSQVDNPFEYIKDVNFTTYNGTDQSIVPVFKVGDEYIIGGGGFAITESRFIRLSPPSSPLFMAKMELPIIPNFDEVATQSVRQDDLIGRNKIVFYEYDGVSLNFKDVTIDGELRNINFNFMSAIDINRDGFEDIVVLPYTIEGAPVFYINNSGEKFIRQDINIQNFFRYHRDTATPIIADFDNDGIYDIVTVPANGNDIGKGRAMTDYLYYKGSQN